MRTRSSAVRRARGELDAAAGLGARRRAPPPRRRRSGDGSASSRATTGRSRRGSACSSTWTVAPDTCGRVQRDAVDRRAPAMFGDELAHVGAEDVGRENRRRELAAEVAEAAAAPIRRPRTRARRRRRTARRGRRAAPRSARRAASGRPRGPGRRPRAPARAVRRPRRRRRPRRPAARGRAASRRRRSCVPGRTRTCRAPTCRQPAATTSPASPTAGFVVPPPTSRFSNGTSGRARDSSPAAPANASHDSSTGSDATATTASPTRSRTTAASPSAFARRAARPVTRAPPAKTAARVEARLGEPSVDERRDRLEVQVVAAQRREDGTEAMAHGAVVQGQATRDRIAREPRRRRQPARGRGADVEPEERDLAHGGDPAHR